jgi:hypothetical protein
MADSKATDGTDEKATSSGGLRTDNYGKATAKEPAAKSGAAADTASGTGVEGDPMKDPALNDFADLEPGESKVVDSGPSTGMNPPASPNGEQVADKAQERHEAGIPSRPIPAADTDLHATSGGYQVTPAGVSPQDLQDRQDSRK